MIPTTTSTPAAGTFAQDAAQTATYPAVHGMEGSVVTVLEVAEPTPQRTVHGSYDGGQVMAVVAPCLFPKVGLELGQAAFPWPARQATPARCLEVIAQKVKAVRPDIHDTGFRRMHHQAGRVAPLTYHGQCLLRLGLAAAKNHEVICVARQLPSLGRHVVVQWIQVDVAQQRTEHCPLRDSGFRLPVRQTVHNAGLEKGVDQSEHPPVGNAFPHPAHQPIVRNRVEIALEVDVHHVHVTLLEQVIHSPQRVFAAPFGPKAVAVRGEFLLEDRFHDVPHRPLDDSITHRRNPQRPLLVAARLRYIRPPNQLGLVSPLAQRRGEFRQLAFEVASKLFDRYMIHARSAAVVSHLTIAGEQVAFRPHLFNQAEPYISFHALFERGQHAVGPHRACGPGPAVPDVSALFSQRHCLRLSFVWSVHSASIFLRPFAPPALPGFTGAMDALASVSFPCRKRISLFHVHDLPTVPSPTTHDRPRSLVCFLSKAYRVPRPSLAENPPVPVGRIVTWASPSSVSPPADRLSSADPDLLDRLRGQIKRPV